MAQDMKSDDTIKWKLGASCSLFNRQSRKWNEGTIVGSFSDENGEWIKVQCESEIHDVLNDDPDLRMADQNGAVISAQKIQELESMARTRPDITSLIEQHITTSNELQSALRITTKS